jgi:acyl-CoA synthetase (AMP-forming)/AMP-acid ligase II
MPEIEFASRADDKGSSRHELSELLPLLEQIWDRVDAGKKLVLSEEQNRAHLQGFVEKGIISSYSVPDRIVFVEALPKTSVGKLDKKVMRERYAPQV